MSTRQGLAHVDIARGADRVLVALTPVGAKWLVHALPLDLLDHFSVHILELPGTARSEGGDNVASVEAQVGSVVDVVEAMEEPCFLFGHSMNGLLAMAAASRTAAQGVIAVSSPPSLAADAEGNAAYWEVKAEPERREKVNAAQAAMDAATSDEEWLRLRGELDRLRRWYDLSLDPSDLDAVAVRTPGWIQSVFASAEVVPWQEITSSVACPVLLTFGEYDFLVPPTAWPPDALPPLATVEMFAWSGHNPFVEEPDEFLAAVSRWLDTAPSA